MRWAFYCRQVCIRMNSVDEINKSIQSLEDKGKVSDGSHTFEELYYHRMILFAAICNATTNSWKSKQHEDGSMYDGYFIAGVTTAQGEFSYHYPIYYWDIFDAMELEFAPKWDGHTSKDVTRLL